MIFQAFPYYQVQRHMSTLLSSFPNQSLDVDVKHIYSNKLLQHVKKTLLAIVSYCWCDTFGIHLILSFLLSPASQNTMNHI